MVDNIDAVITYGWNRVAYNVLRSLSGKGLKVAVGDVSTLAMAGRSKYCSHLFSYPSFYRNPDGFIQSLKLTFKLLKPKVYLPMHEEIFVVAKNIHEFDDLNVIIPISDFESLKSVHKKDSFYDIARGLDIPTPRTFKPASLSDVKPIWKEIGHKGKAVIKLINTNSAKGVFYVTSQENLLRDYGSLVEDGKLEPEQYPIVQEYVKGVGCGVSMLYNAGKPRARFTHKRLREKLFTGGTSTVRESIKNPQMEEYAERLLSSLGWHGVAMVEFKFDEAENKSWMIEVNPRFWGSVALPIQAGVDFPYMLYKMAVDGDVEPVMDYKEGVVARWILGDILAVLSGARQKKSLKPIGDFFRFEKGVKFDDLRRDDLVPFFVQCMYYFLKVAGTMSLNPTDEAMLDVDKL